MENTTVSTEAMQLVVTRLFKESYGIPITQVQEIIKVPDITNIPNMPKFLEGVINLRGKIVPVIDLNNYFAMADRILTDETRIVVSSVGEQPVGLIVDAVSEVLRVPLDAIGAVPPAISTIGTEFVRGVAKIGDQLVIVLNLALVIADLEKKAKIN